ncbi:uncharacterized protein RCC_08854 [Lecanosticta acicola]|uniref:Uncharacterized protein RCC_08854 n=1 Tax=Lecanosticta acicola TaxID=111012 RepID=A0AAI8Z5N9_9PEZI|nr:uncharacterized protein RCC_08854 [Lecanosticta acicola]
MTAIVGPEMEMWTDGSVVPDTFSGWAFTLPSLPGATTFKGQWFAKRRESDVTLTELRGIRAALQYLTSSSPRVGATEVNSARRIDIHTDCQDALDEINLERGDGYELHRNAFGWKCYVEDVPAHHLDVVRGIIASVETLLSQYGIRVILSWQRRRTTAGGIVADNWASQGAVTAMRLAGTTRYEVNGTF